MTARAGAALAARTAAGFGAFGVYWTTLTVANPAMQHDFGLSEGALGRLLSLLLVIGAGLMFLGARIAAQHGPFGLMRAGLAGLATTAALSAAAPSLPLFALSLMAAGVACGLLEVAINTAGIQVDLDAGRPVLAWLHAAFNGGSFVWALVLAGVVQLGGGRTALFATSAVGIALATVVVPARRHATVPSGPRHSSLRDVLRTRPRVLVLGVLCALAFFAEGAVGLWSFRYLDRDLHAPPIIAGAGFALFEATMLVGRLALPRVQGSLANRALLALLGAALLVATAVSVATTLLPITILGFFLCGLAISAMVPTLMAVAGEIAPDRLAAASALITLVGYVGLTLGPLAIGSLADIVSLRVALGVSLAASAVLTVAASRGLPARRG